MAEIDKLTPTNILLVLQFLAPGALIVYFRSLFVTRRLAGFKDNISLFIVLSIIYAFVLLPIVGLTGGTISTRPWWAWLVWLLALVVIPAAASNLEHKDLFVEELYDLDSLGNWSKRLNRQAIFILGKSIRYVEFVFG